MKQWSANDATADSAVVRAPAIANAAVSAGTSRRLRDSTATPVPVSDTVRAQRLTEPGHQIPQFAEGQCAVPVDEGRSVRIPGQGPHPEVADERGPVDRGPRRRVRLCMVWLESAESGSTEIAHSFGSFASALYLVGIV